MTICENPALASFLTDLKQQLRKQQSGMSHEWPRVRPTKPLEGIPHDEEPDSKD
jgi:hypothetical protein